MPVLPRYICGLLAVAFIGCRHKERVEVYKIPKESGLAQEQSSAISPQEEGVEPLELYWQIPPGWRKQSVDAAFKKASFLIAGSGGRQAEISVTTFPGLAGGVLANVNRWRQQLGLAPLREAELKHDSENLATPLGPMLFVDFVSQGPLVDNKWKRRILAALITIDGSSWFFKMSGEDSLVRESQSVFRQFLKSVHVQSQKSF